MPANRFDPLLKHAETCEEKAARQYAEKLKALSDNEQRLHELARYAAEYAAPDRGASTAALLVNRQRFRERVQSALDQQKTIVERSRASADLERARLLLASRDSKALEQLAASHRVRAARAAGKREQTNLDDLAARQHRSRRERNEP